MDILGKYKKPQLILKVYLVFNINIYIQRSIFGPYKQSCLQTFKIFESAILAELKNVLIFIVVSFARSYGKKFE